jgi:hemerythrin-like metal-binding protein
MDNADDVIRLPASPSIPPLLGDVDKTLSFLYIFERGHSVGGIQFIVWKDEYEVGHPVLDAHHQLLIEIINSLYEAAAAGASETQLDETMREIDAYARRHFHTEEEILAAVGYPHLSRQEKAHEDYVRKVDELKRSFFLPSGGLSQEILHFLKNWWLTHIVTMDKEYSGYLNLPLPG